MQIVLRTPVRQPYQQVWRGFNRSLFDALNPPFPPAEVVRFDGSLKGDLVQVRLNFLLFKQDWISRITDQQENEREIFFVDEGVKLPFFLAYWHHKHRIVRDGDHSIIIDEITFRSPTRLTDFLLYPILYGQFLYRRPIYRRMFR